VSRRRARTALLLGWLVLSGGRPARAFTIASGFSESCHERLGLAAMAVLIADLPTDHLLVPADGLWRDVAAQLAPLLLDTGGLASAATLTDAQKFVLFSLVVGIRAPDTGGHSVANLEDLRNEQIDPSPESQHLHCLRAPAEDGFAGDVAVLNGSQAVIRATLGAGLAALATGRANIQAPFYLDFYGQLQVAVDPLSYAIGRAMHTLQDCYAHTLRSADGQTVFTVFNYIEAVRGTLNEARDGMAHSDAMDDCHDPALDPLVARAAAVSTGLAAAAQALAATGDTTLLDKGFAACAPGDGDTATCAWMQYTPSCQPNAQPPDTAACCSQANAYCAAPLLSIARQDLTRPTSRRSSPAGSLRKAADRSLGRGRHWGCSRPPGSGGAAGEDDDRGPALPWSSPPRSPRVRRRPKKRRPFSPTASSPPWKGTPRCCPTRRSARSSTRRSATGSARDTGCAAGA
jgi:hypothetical protein